MLKICHIAPPTSLVDVFVPTQCVGEKMGFGGVQLFQELKAYS
jgi:hypothetical protein